MTTAADEEDLTFLIEEEKHKNMISQGSSFLDRYDAETNGIDKKTSSDEANGTATDPDDTTGDEEYIGGGSANWANAPPVEYIDKLKGYELVSFDAINVPPPPPEVITTTEDEDEEGKQKAKEEPPPPPPPPVRLESESKLTEEQTKAALLEYIANHCCYGKGAARNMTIKKMEYLPAFHYELQTFSEKRETSWTYSPLMKNGYVETGGYGGGPPLPWEIEEYPNQAFKDEVRLVPVPNTISIKTCHRCRGTGGIVCKECSGKGWSRCIHCHGDGYLADGSGMRERCFYCQHSKHGHGQLDCAKCHTKGKVNCVTCEGNGQIKCYIQLSITWKVHTAEHISSGPVGNEVLLPHELIRDVSGQVAFEEEAEKVNPLETNPDQGIKAASMKLIGNHMNNLADQKIVCQRHQIRIVPLTRVTYEWKNRLHLFNVYGYENKVHLAKYPQSCCWGCQIL